MTQTSVHDANISGAATPKASRYQWMDISRGLGVLLIVIVHAGAIFSERSGQAVPTLVRVADLALSPFRIPLLIFLSGILLTRSLAKGSERFVTGKIKNLAWPFLIWTLVIVLSMSGPAGLSDPKPWLGGTVLWYLSFLFLYYAVGLLFARVPVLVIAAYALAFSMILPTDTRYGSRMLLLMSYFFVGAFVGQNLDRFTDAIRSKWIVALLPLLLALSYYFTTQDAEFKYSPYVAPLIIALVVSMCGVFNLFVSGAVARAFQFAGRNSLVYYVMHAPIYFLLYDTLLRNNIRSPYFGPAVGLVLGLSIPTAVALLRERGSPVKWLFESPDFRFPAPLSRLALQFDKLVLPARMRSGKLSTPAERAPGDLAAGVSVPSAATHSALSASTAPVPANSLEPGGTTFTGISANS